MHNTTTVHAASVDLADRIDTYGRDRAEQHARARISEAFLHQPHPAWPRPVRSRFARDTEGGRTRYALAAYRNTRHASTGAVR